MIAWGLGIIFILGLLLLIALCRAAAHGDELDDGPR